MLTGLIAEVQQDRALAADWRHRVVEPLRSQSAIMFDRAISRGEIPADTDKDVLLDLLYGPAYHRLLHGHRPLTDQFARQVVDLIVAGLSADRPYQVGADQDTDRHSRRPGCARSRPSLTGCVC